MAERLYSSPEAAQRDIQLAEQELARAQRETGDAVNADRLVLMRGSRAEQWLRNQNYAAGTGPAPHPFLTHSFPQPSAPQGDEDPEPQYGYAREDMSTDRGRLPLNDPSMIASERRDRVLNEGRSLAATGIESATRRGQKRRATSLHGLLTSGSPSDQDYWAGQREKVNPAIHLGGGDTARRLSPTSDTAYSSSTGVLIDADERRRGPGMQARAEAKEEGLRSYVHPETGVSLPMRPSEGWLQNAPAGAQRLQRIKVSPKTRLRVKEIREDRKKSRADIKRKHQARFLGTGGQQQQQQPGEDTGVAGPRRIRHPVEDLTPQERQRHQAGLKRGDERSIRFQEAADRHVESRQRQETARFTATTGRINVLGDQDGDKPSSVFNQDDANDIASVTTGPPPGGTMTEGGSLYTKAAKLWNRATAAQQKTPDKFVAWALNQQPGQWDGGKERYLRNLWYRRYQMTHPEGKSLIGEDRQYLPVPTDDGFHHEDGGLWPESWGGSPDIPDQITIYQQPGQHAANPGGVPSVTRPRPPRGPTTTLPNRRSGLHP